MGDKLPRGIYALLDDASLAGRDPLGLALQAVQGGAGTVQLRLKQTPDREVLALARALAPRVPALVIDDRPDLALLAGCGVHLGEHDVPVPLARALLGPHALVGATCRTLADVVRAAREGADHAGVGPVFKSRTKPLPHPPLGPQGLAEICAKSPLPVVAISGIDLTNVAAVAQAGAHAAAVASAIFSEPDPQRAVASMLSVFGR